MNCITFLFLDDMLDRQCSSSELNSETSVPNSSGESPAPGSHNATNSMKRPIPAQRSASTKLSKELLKSCESATLKSYNPNRKLKRNRNSWWVFSRCFFEPFLLILSFFRSSLNVAEKTEGGDQNCDQMCHIYCDYFTSSTY